MKQIFLRNEGNERLLLFFAGWGADEHLFDEAVQAGYDYMICFDYTTLDFDFSLLQPYREIRLLAWSMGVWAATQTFAGREIPWEMKVAVNGTSRPVDDRYGIPVAVFRGTLDGFSAVTLAKFRRRMCGNADGVKTFLSRIPYRTLEELHSELSAVYSQVTERAEADFKWDKAVVSMRDKIFPAVNMLAAWEGTPVEEVDAEHYDAALFTRYLKGEEGTWTKR